MGPVGGRMRRAVGYLQGATTAPHTGESAIDDAAIAAAAVSLGLVLVRTYADARVEPGAALDARPGLVNALGILEPGDTLVVAQPDHLGADPMHQAMVERVVEKKGACVVFVPLVAGTEREPNAVTQRVREAFAEYEELLTTTQRRAAPRARPSRPGALDVGAGKVATRFVEGGDDPTTGSDPQQAANAVMAVVRGHLQAGWAAPDIAEELNRRALVSSDGAPWRGEAVRAIIEQRHLDLVQVDPGFKRAKAFATAPVAVPHDPVLPAEPAMPFRGRFA